MPTPLPGKHRGQVVRQLSLQNQPTVPVTNRGVIKKQLSQDDSRFLVSATVTGHGFDRSDSRVGPGGLRVGQTKVTTARPKPVKVAWADKKPESPAGVEVIATKCQGQPRPTTLRNQRLRSPLLGNKDTLVYTRLQLAERLRNAWSEREKIKPNINIFLARAPDTTRSENNEPTNEPTADDGASAFSDTLAPLDKKRKAVRAFSQEFLTNDHGYVGYATSESEETQSNLTTRTAEDKQSRQLQELNKIEIRMTKIDRNGSTDGVENKPPEDSIEVKRSRNKTENDSKDTAVTAQDRRANFRRSSFLQKTITESFSSDKNPDEDVKVTAKKKTPLVRAFSAPSQNEGSDVHKAANIQKKVKMAPQRRLQPAVSFDLSSINSEDTTASRERIKSAPVRRRFKSTAVRKKNKDKDSSDEEKGTKESAASKTTTTTTNNNHRRSTQLKKGADIVTMVSLVSPAESDTEESVINLPMESWRGEEKEESLQSGKSSAVAGEELKDSAVAVQKFVSLRKTAKSVTFQPHPVLNRGYSASFPSRRAPAGTPIIVPPPIVTNPALTPAQLLERDKRAAAFSAATADGRGIKRRLPRSSSDFHKDDDADEKSRENGGEIIGRLSENANRRKEEEEEERRKKEKEEEAEDIGGEEKTNGQPELKCPKERECWNLYQKMVEKGVSVSFDTVLRGMLTPTEYRLRKNQLLSNGWG